MKKYISEKIGGKIFIIRRTHLVTLSLLLAVIAIFYVINHPMVVGRENTEQAMPIYSMAQEQKVLALTFNVSSTSDEHTQRVVNALNNEGVHATFFVTGDWIRENRTLAEQIVFYGHELMNLSDDHSLLRRLNTQHLRENLETCSQEIYEVMGVLPSFFRAPYGEYDTRLVEVANTLGMQAVQWSVDSGDWRGLQADAIVRQTLNRAFPGGIVLLHSNLPQTALAMPLLLEQLRITGYEILPLSQLIYQGEYVVGVTN